jgi:hypothetical protein
MARQAQLKKFMENDVIEAALRLLSQLGFHVRAQKDRTAGEQQHIYPDESMGRFSWLILASVSQVLPAQRTS